MMSWFPLTFQNGLSSGAVSLEWLADYICILLVFTLGLVGGLLALAILPVTSGCHAPTFAWVEAAWTAAPALALLLVGGPSLSHLYSQESLGRAEICLSATGNQWYWAYSFGGAPAASFDAYLTSTGDAQPGDPRCLETDNHVVLPINATVRVTTTSGDVLHSWSLPAMGVKGDATPGRMNALDFEGRSACVVYGQCSEICGANHSFMPISVEMVPFSSFASWLSAL